MNIAYILNESYDEAMERFRLNICQYGYEPEYFYHLQDILDMEDETKDLDVILVEAECLSELRNMHILSEYMKYGSKSVLVVESPSTAQPLNIKEVPGGTRCFRIDSTISKNAFESILDMAVKWRG